MSKKWKDYVAEGFCEVRPSKDVNTECPNLEVDISANYGHRLVCRETTFVTTDYFDCKSCKRIYNKKEKAKRYRGITCLKKDNSLHRTYEVEAKTKEEATIKLLKMIKDDEAILNINTDIAQIFYTDCNAVDDMKELTK